MIPNSKPKLTYENATNYFVRFLQQYPAAKGELDPYPVRLLGVRGYYRDSMGEPGENDRGIYDDAIFLLTPQNLFAYNANVDPSRVRNGGGYGPGKGMASLKCGLWLYKPGIHGLSKPVYKQYPAFVQAKPVVVIRDASGPDYQDGPGYFGINIHRGGTSTTSSEGCQTIPPLQWDSFYGSTRGAMASYRQEVIPYLLAEVVQ